MESVGLYIHIPFCVKKCSYCDFPSFAGRESDYQTYVLALISELRNKADKRLALKTVFIGGGTPTALPQALLLAVINTVFEEYTVLENAEVSIEANPGTLNSEMLLALKNAGVNRLSIGLQAWQDSLLLNLGRMHCLEDFLQNFHNARAAGLKNISVDLMFALPGQTLFDWQETLKNVVALNPEHISAYSLIVEEGTPFFTAYEKGELLLTSDLLDRQMYEEAKRILAEAGYCQYEISNFSKTGFESIHNKAYWQTLDYIGCGLGAHSCLLGQRFHNTYSLEQYIEERGDCSPLDQENLSLSMQQSEFMFCGLRMTEGVTYEAFFSRFGKTLEAVYGDVIERFVSKGLLCSQKGRLFLTDRGVDVSNIVFQEFLI